MRYAPMMRRLRVSFDSQGRAVAVASSPSRPSLLAFDGRNGNERGRISGGLSADDLLALLVRQSR